MVNVQMMSFCVPILLGFALTSIMYVTGYLIVLTAVMKKAAVSFNENNWTYEYIKNLFTSLVSCIHNTILQFILTCIDQLVHIKYYNIFKSLIMYCCTFFNLFFNWVKFKLIVTSKNIYKMLCLRFKKHSFENFNSC